MTFRSLYLRWLNRTDPTARVVGFVYTTPRHYDEAKAVAGAAKAKTQSATGRPFERKTV